MRYACILCHCHPGEDLSGKAQEGGKSLRTSVYFICLILFTHVIAAWRNSIPQSVSGRAQARTQIFGVLLHVYKDGCLWACCAISSTNEKSVGDSQDFVLLTTAFSAPWVYILGAQ